MKKAFDEKNRIKLIIQGARQVGKTWIMKEFGKRYFENVVYINFENNERMKNLHQGTSFPVGKVEFLHLYPLNFYEFLMATGQDALAELLEQQDYELMNSFSSKYIDLLRKYYYVGGMPEAVQCYIDTDDMQEVRNIQKELLVYYENDFSKHAPKETVPRIQMVWNSIPAQLAKENRKFIYAMVRKGALLLFNGKFCRRN